MDLRSALEATRVSRLLAIVVHRAAPLLLTLGVLLVLRLASSPPSGTDSTTIAVGFMLIAAFVAGKVAVRGKLPRITGYLLIGVLVGPGVTGLLTREMLVAAKAVEGIAVALIALTAGGEIRLDWVKKNAARVSLITVIEMLAVGAGVLGTVMLVRRFLPFMPSAVSLEALVIALVFGVIAMANSPTVTIAVIAENRAEGPLTRTVLGVTILKDVFVIVLFAITLTLAKRALGEAGEQSVALTLLRELGGSVVVGVLFGIGIALFLRFVGRDTPLFILAICFAIWQISSAFHLEALLVALSAGFWVENFSRAEGEHLIKAIERLSLPVYALFFAAAGAKVDIDALATLWPFALILAGARAVCVKLSVSAGARLAKTEPVIQRYAWLGLISQAGVTLALSTIVARTFPTWGVGIQAVILAMIAMHELVGPIGFQYALAKAGEIGRAVRGSTHDSAADSERDASAPAGTG